MTDVALDLLATAYWLALAVLLPYMAWRVGRTSWRRYREGRAVPPFGDVCWNCQHLDAADRCEAHRHRRRVRFPKTHTCAQFDEAPDLWARDA